MHRYIHNERFLILI
ncbi:hypothetical protein ECTW09195_3632, partial [Escherichia coli TW09195]